MKVYVDELPKNCEMCPLRIYECDSHWCACYEGSTILFASEVKEANLCPLQPLADHDKQIRKQVCDEIAKSIKDIKNKIFDRYPEGAVLSEYYSQRLRCYDEILNIIKKVEKGEK